MAPLANLTGTDASIKFSSLTDKLLSFTHSRVNDKKAIDTCLTEFNSLDYRSILIENNNVSILSLRPPGFPYIVTLLNTFSFFHRL